MRTSRASLKGQKQLLEQRVDELEGAQVAAESLEFELKARQIEIMLRIQERQQMFADGADRPARSCSTLKPLVGRLTSRSCSPRSSRVRAARASRRPRVLPSRPRSPTTACRTSGVAPRHAASTAPASCSTSSRSTACSSLTTRALSSVSARRSPLGSMVPGDVVFFGSPIHHVGMYMGGGYYIHAPRTGDFVKISKLADRSDFAGARRYAWRPARRCAEGRREDHGRRRSRATPAPASRCCAALGSACSTQR